MANYIERVNFSARKYVTPTSRYVNSQPLYYSDQKKLTFETYKRKNLSSNNDVFTLISGGLEYRPDLVSYLQYGVVDFWWKILEVNNMKDIWEFKSGKTIRLPVRI